MSCRKRLFRARENASRFTAIGCLRHQLDAPARDHTSPTRQRGTVPDRTSPPTQPRWGRMSRVAWMILRFADIVDDVFQGLLIVDIEPTSTLCPPFLANRPTGDDSGGGCALPFLLHGFQPSGAPRFELLTDIVGVAMGRDDDVHMIRAAIDGMESPTTNPAMVGDGGFDEAALFVVKAAGILSHACGRLPCNDGIWELHSAPVLDPSPLVAGQPCAIGGPRQEVGERFRHGRFALAFGVRPALEVHHDLLLCLGLDRS